MVEVIEESGKVSVMRAIHLPVNGKSKGWHNHSEKTLIKMIKRGDEHSKTERLLVAYLEITAPRDIWSELDTYTVGVIPGSSESTMYTLIKTLKKGGDLTPLFTANTSPKAIAALIDAFEDNRDADNLIEIVKDNLPEGFLQKRVRAFSYQALRRMYKQRKNHRLPWWGKFFKELIPQLDHQQIIKETWLK